MFHVAVGIGGRSFDQVFENTLAFVASHNSMIANRPDVFVRIDSAEDLAGVSGSGRIGLLIGTQTSSHFRSPEDVDLFHGLASGSRS